MERPARIAAAKAVGCLIKEYWTHEVEAAVPDHLMRIIDHLDDNAPQDEASSSRAA
jgi:hypothetical protein